MGKIDIDIDAAVAFLAGHGRVLDRRRLDVLLGGGDVDAVSAALDAYRNDDGGFGWGIEPDLRSPESQPAGAMHAFEVLAEMAEVAGVAARPSSRSVELCDWLEEHTSPDGALPFTLPVRDPAGCAALWLGDDHATASLQMTAQVAANAHLLARNDPAVASHPWLARATRWTYDAISRLDATPQAHELLFATRFLDAVADADPEGAALLDHLRRLIPPDGVVPVEGGSPDEALRPLDFAPRPRQPARRLFTADVLSAELARLAGLQQPDGGWRVDFASASPVAALEWRGYATVGAITILRSETRR